MATKYFPCATAQRITHKIVTQVSLIRYRSIYWMTCGAACAANDRAWRVQSGNLPVFDCSCGDRSMSLVQALSLMQRPPPTLDAYFPGNVSNDGGDPYFAGQLSSAWNPPYRRSWRIWMIEHSVGPAIGQSHRNLVQHPPIFCVHIFEVV